MEPGPQSSIYGAFHTSEVPYVFGALDKAPERPITELDRHISARVMRYWVNFIKTGNPNGAALPQWPQFSGNGDVINLGAATEPYPRLADDKLGLFRRHLNDGGSLFIF